MILIVIVSSANVDKIYFEYSPEEPENVESKQNTGETNEVFAENFKLLHGPRHDEFDWSLTKVSGTYLL